MAEKKEAAIETAEPKTKKAKTTKGLSYAEVLEARAQRGSMTHQKRFAIEKAKEKEMKEK